MYRDEHIDVWNLTAGSIVQNGAQTIFNLVGCLKNPERVSKLLYSINGEPERPAFFNASKLESGRLRGFGHFNIDTLKCEDLKDSNVISFTIIYTDETIVKSEISFQKSTCVQNIPNYTLSFEGVSSAEQVGQIVDGNWHVSKDEQGVPCLEIRAEDTGLDRIILFGNHEWKTGYEISTKLLVRKWMRYPHNVGILFKWNPHLQGDGTLLPTQWSTGLAYFYSDCPGLRIRFGVDVHRDKDGKKHGDSILKEKTLSPWRRWIGRNLNRLLGKELIYTQMKPNVKYNFNALIHPDKYTLTVWEDGKKRPKPQINISNPSEKLENGSVGIIAHRCAMRIYDFNVTPL